MKKRLVSLFIVLLLVMGSVMTVNAETFQGKSNWKVVFTGDKMESNFGSKSINDNLPDQFQPGDDITFTVDLKNKADFTTDWYMTNEVLSTLEESQSVANSGNYTYRLTYKNDGGETTTLYDSDSVGGEKSTSGGEGLHEATDSLEEYLYLDRLKAGEGGQVSLYLKVEGETEGNAYQDTLAKLRMNFAVEKADESTTTTPNSSNNRNRQPGRGTVKTGDSGHMLLWALLALASGVLCLIVAILRRREERGGMESAGRGSRRGRKNRGAGAGKVLAGFIVAGLLLQMASVNSLAADNTDKSGRKSGEDYTYTITFYAGNRGTFAGGKSSIKVTGKKLGDNIVFDLGQVQVSDDKYYAKGIRKSGRDNNEVSMENLAFKVTEDADYTVAYGIKGDLVAYTVNYQDEDGNALAASRTYYGNVGDKPVVAFLYMEGYQPQAYNLTKTLSSDESKNIFTFKYSKGETATPEQTQNAGNGAAAGNGANAGNAAAAGNGATVGNGAAAGNAANAGNDANAGNAANAGNDANAGNAAPVTELPDEAVPTTDGTEDLVDLDDEDTPLANVDASSGAKKFGNPYVIAAAGVVLLAGLVGLFVWMKRRKTEDDGKYEE